MCMKYAKQIAKADRYLTLCQSKGYRKEQQEFNNMAEEAIVTGDWSKVNARYVEVEFECRQGE